MAFKETRPTKYTEGSACRRLEQTRDFIMKSRGVGYSQEAAAIQSEDIEQQMNLRYKNSHAR